MFQFDNWREANICRAPNVISAPTISSLYFRCIKIGAHQFSRKHPLSCWVSCMCSIFAGGFLAAFLLGEPVLSAVKNTNQIVVATAIWYLIFYSPLDFFYKLCKWFPIKLTVSAMKEVIRCKKVHDGVVHAGIILDPFAFAIRNNSHFL